MNTKDLVLEMTRPALTDESLSDDSKALYAYLVLNSVVENDCGPVVMTTNEAQALLGKTRTTVLPAMQALIDRGYIKRSKTRALCSERGMNTYTVISLEKENRLRSRKPKPATVRGY